MKYKRSTPKYLDLPYYSPCGCKLEVIDEGLRTMFTRCALHAAALELLDALKAVHSNHAEMLNPCGACAAISKAEGRQ